MRRVIYIPDVEESIPYISYHYLLPVLGKYVFDCIVSDTWTTDGEIIHDMTDDKTITVQLTGPAVHHYAGWEF
jgi:hypothetical protein